jgi:hypothetical protein
MCINIVCTSRVHMYRGKVLWLQLVRRISTNFQRP